MVPSVCEMWDVDGEGEGVTWTRIPLQCVTVTRPTSNGFNLDEYSSSQHSECGEKENCLAQGNRHIFIILCRTFRENSESNKLQQTHNTTTTSSLMSALLSVLVHRYMFNHLSSCLDSNEMQTLITRTGATSGGQWIHALCYQPLSRYDM